jgi:DNA-binding FadR family transcriptional regulator
VSVEAVTLRVPTAAEILAANLRRQIVTGELTRGQRLPPEPYLRQRFQVSRATLREAFRVLESEGLIAVRRGARGGAEVCHPEPEIAARYFGLLLQTQDTTLGDFQRAREVLEPPMAGLLAERSAPEAIAALEEALAGQAAVLDEPVSYAHASVHFHDVVALHCGSPTLGVLLGLMDAVLHQHAEVRLKEESTPASIRKGHRAHAKLVDLVRAGDAVEAEKLWGEHVRQLGAALLKDSAGKQVVDLFD